MMGIRHLNFKVVVISENIFVRAIFKAKSFGHQLLLKGFIVSISRRERRDVLIGLQRTWLPRVKGEI